MTGSPITGRSYPKKRDEAALYAVRRGVAVDGVTGEVEDTLPAGAAPGTE